MNIINKKDVIHPPSSLRITNENTEYINDFPAISKMDNIEVILEYINLIRKDTGVSLTMDDIPKSPKGSVYKH